MLILTIKPSLLCILASYAYYTYKNCALILLMDTKSILYFNISENLSALRLLKYWYDML